MILIAGLVSAVLVFLAGLHGYWGLGGVWPGRTPQTLADKVLGAPDGRMAPPFACFVVMAALLVAAGAVLLSVQVPLARPVAFLTAGVFLLRGALGYVMPRLTRTGEEFDRLNRVIYSPLCLALGALTLLTLRP